MSDPEEPVRGHARPRPQRAADAQGGRKGDQPAVSAAPADSAAPSPELPSRPPVMGDVARLASVSHQTVSRVLNDQPNVRAETRARVLSAMRELDYRPNVTAQALVTGRTRTLVVASLDTTLYGPSATLFSIEQAAREEGYLVSIVSLKSLHRTSVVGAVEQLRDRAADGIIVIGPHVSAPGALVHVPSGVPVVFVEGAPDASVPIVGIDQAASAARATQYLMDLGHESVWHIAGPPDWYPSRQRIEGWRSVLEAAGAKVPTPLGGDWTARSGYELGQRLAGQREVSAIFVANDQMALGVLRALREARRHVPGDVSVVGFDDIPEAAYFTPPLTTVRQDFAQIGRRSVRLLLDQIESGARDLPRVTVPAELVVRESTGAAPAEQGMAQR